MSLRTAATYIIFCNVKRHQTLALLASILLLSCATSPTGRKQVKLLPDSQLAQMGAQSFAELKKKTPPGKSRTDRVRVLCISHALLRAIGESPDAWEIQVFEDKSPNAFALPGKKIGVHTGMIRLAKNDSQLAAVIGHEIGHVLAAHGNERVSQQLGTQVLLAGASLALGNNPKTDKMILMGLGVGAQFGVLLPFSRSHEREADRLGLQYMAQAGFDPREASNLWVQMSRASGGSSQPEFLSTHPSPSSRIQDLAQRAPAFMAAYKAAPRPRCSQ